MEVCQAAGCRITITTACVSTQHVTARVKACVSAHFSFSPQKMDHVDGFHEFTDLKVPIPSCNRTRSGVLADNTCLVGLCKIILERRVCRGDASTPVVVNNRPGYLPSREETGSLGHITVSTEGACGGQEGRFNAGAGGWEFEALGGVEGYRSIVMENAGLLGCCRERANGRLRPEFLTGSKHAAQRNPPPLMLINKRIVAHHTPDASVEAQQEERWRCKLILEISPHATNCQERSLPLAPLLFTREALLPEIADKKSPTRSGKTGAIHYIRYTPSGDSAVAQPPGFMPMPPFIPEGMEHG
ncbi:hypothetical protein K488DRAFT_74712 [Vararia minispora EC-137]|uniref:Uncharacterized protein n=1 Tax=Vararia minispora EC-137 TaxID=1314806 RepID=A0ACB8Q6G6_9AGAM|nr:hypothetical protein K488DRAFT_74712 [Vararia minispora EC-137]